MMMSERPFARYLRERGWDSTDGADGEMWFHPREPERYFSVSAAVEKQGEWNDRDACEYLHCGEPGGCPKHPVST